VIGKYTFIGDTNLDGAVTAEDYSPIDSALAGGGISAGATYFNGDMDVNGTVDAQDYSPIDQNINVSDPTNPYVPVPEPSLGLFSMLTFGFWTGKRIRKARMG
jgi:hypothetical protein